MANAVVQKKGRVRWSRIIFNLILFACVTIVVVWTIAPFLWMVNSSFMPRYELLSWPPHWIPENPTLENYQAMFDPRYAAQQQWGSTTTTVAKSAAGDYAHTLKNSFIVAISATVVTLIAASLGAYALARIRWPGKAPVILGLVATRMIPGIGLLIPLYILISKLHQLDTYQALIYLEGGSLLPFTMFILYGVFQAIPKEIEESAFIDGASRFQVIYKIVLPLSTHGFVAAGTFTFLGSWNSFMTPLIFTSIRAKTFPLKVAELVTMHDINYTAIASTGVFASIVPIVLALLFQRYIVRGLTEGAVKG